jgi:hypothetical protein
MEHDPLFRGDIFEDLGEQASRVSHLPQLPGFLELAERSIYSPRTKPFDALGPPEPIRRIACRFYDSVYKTGKTWSKLLSGISRNE